MQGDPSLCVHHVENDDFTHLSFLTDKITFGSGIFSLHRSETPCVYSRGLGGKGRKKEQIIFSFSRSAPVGNEPARSPVAARPSLNVMMKSEA